MPPLPSKPRFLWSLAAALMAAVAIAFVFMQPAAAQTSGSALPVARSYLVTGNYAVIGVDLLPQQADCATFSPACYVTGGIQVNQCTGAPDGTCIPAGADVLAAFLYWETLSTAPSTIPVT